MKNQIETLKQALDNSKYTVVLCGSEMLTENGFPALKSRDTSYELTEKYGIPPESIYTSAYYSTRTHEFFDFYKNEVLNFPLEPTKTGLSLAAMEQAGKVHCVITTNIYDIPHRSGCKKFINLHGDVFHNHCPHCGKTYPMEYVRDAKKAPLCEKCSTVIRPDVALFGEMIDNQIMTLTTEEIERADLLILLGTNVKSEVYRPYIKYFQGDKMAVIHSKEHFSDHIADIVIYEYPEKGLELLGY